MKAWEKSKHAARGRAIMRNELRRSGPTFTECAASMPPVGARCSVQAQDASGRYGLPFAVKLTATGAWVRDDGRAIDVRIAAWRPA